VFVCVVCVCVCVVVGVVVGLSAFGCVRVVVGVLFVIYVWFWGSTIVQYACDRGGVVACACCWAFVFRFCGMFFVAVLCATVFAAPSGVVAVVVLCCAVLLRCFALLVLLPVLLGLRPAGLFVRFCSVVCVCGCVVL